MVQIKIQLNHFFRVSHFKDARTKFRFFLRISTHPKIFENPLKPNQATQIVDLWLLQPNVEFLSPNEESWNTFKDFWVNSQGGSNLSTDAHIASVALNHGLIVYSNDTDFARFPSLKWLNPIK